MSGTQEFLNSKLLTEAGPAGLLDEQGEASDIEDRIDRTLPGSNRGGDPSARKHLSEVRVTGVAFAPTGRAFCAASTEGLLIYSLDTTHLFDPYDLDVTVTPASTLNVLHHDKNYLKALVMAFRLNEAPLLRKVFEGIPYINIALVVQELPVVYVPRLLRFVALQMEESPHLEFCLLWIRAILDCHGKWIWDNRGTVDAEMRSVSRSVGKIRDDLRLLADENIYMLDYLLSQPAAAGSVNLRGVAEPSKPVTDGEKKKYYIDEGSDAEWIGLD